MTLRTAQARANREKPATGQHRFTWGDPFGNAQDDHFSQIGRCTCGAEVMVSNHGPKPVQEIRRHAQRTARIIPSGPRFELITFENGEDAGSVYADKRSDLVTYTKTHAYKFN